MEVKQVADNGYLAGCLYVPVNLVERMVLENPPVPPPQPGVQLAQTPKSGATIVTDRVGAHLTKVDKVIYMQNNVGSDFWDIARKMAKFQIVVQFKYIFIMVGLDWCLSAKKYMVREGLRRLLYNVTKISGNRATVAICGITPRYENYREMKCKMVTYNRYLADAVRECATGLDRSKVVYLPLHLHFLHQDGEFISPLLRYFNRFSEFTLAGGFVLREMVLKEVGTIPMDGMH